MIATAQTEQPQTSVIESGEFEPGFWWVKLTIEGQTFRGHARSYEQALEIAQQRAADPTGEKHKAALLAKYPQPTEADQVYLTEVIAAHFGTSRHGSYTPDKPMSINPYWDSNGRPRP